MRAEFQRSKSANSVYEWFIKNGIAVRLDIPHKGVLWVKGEAMRELIWMIKSHDNLQRLELWLDMKKQSFAKSLTVPAPNAIFEDDVVHMVEEQEEAANGTHP